MKKVIAILAVVFTMAMAAACGAGNSSTLIPDNLEVKDSTTQENSAGNSSEKESGKVVQPITGGGDFNAGNNYNK